MQTSSQIETDARRAASGPLIVDTLPSNAACGLPVGDTQHITAASSLPSLDTLARRVVRRGVTFTYPPEALIELIVTLWRDRIKAQKNLGDEARYLLSRCREICRPDHEEEWQACVVRQETKKMPKLNKDARRLRIQLCTKRPILDPHPRLLQTAAIDPDFVQWRENARLKVAAIEKRMAPLAEQLPVWSTWAKHVPGLGAISVLGIVAECPHISDLIDYDEKRAKHAGGSSAAGWTGPYKMNKRFGLAVTNGKRQRNTRDEGRGGDGYAPRRKSLLWNCARTLVQNKSPYLPVYIREWKKWTETEGGKPILKKGPADWVWSLEEDATKGRPNRYNHSLGVTSKQMLIDFWRVWHGFGCRTNYQPVTATRS